ncbi:MAG: hypothetical protein HYV09_01325 [Deltaproteobacteria bacterium]|nr:hypothetical protein [Deltaproteobacteria bacterium]
MPAPPPSSSRETGRVAPESARERAHFSLFGIPVRIGLGFWLIAFVLGFQPGAASFAAGARNALAWTAILFVSILLHELGHALVARAFGARPVISLHAFGGLTQYIGVGMSRGRQILVSLAGPFTGFAFGALVFLAGRRFAAVDPALVRHLLLVNVGWGMVNLLPVLPLDGGNVLAAALGPKRTFATWVISGTFAVAVTVLGLYLRQIFIVVLFGFAAVQAIGQARLAWAARVDARDGLERLLASAKLALERGELDDAHLIADDVIGRAKSQAVRNGGYTALAWVFVERGQGSKAKAALAEIDPPYAVDPYTMAAVEDAAGDAGRARAILEEARRQGFRTIEAGKLLIDLYARDGRLEAAVDVAQEDADLLSRDEVHAVFQAAMDGGATRAAARVAARMFELHGRPSDAIDEARALALSDDVAGALAALAHAVAVGPIDREAIRNDPAFAQLVGDERFERIVS